MWDSLSQVINMLTAKGAVWANVLVFKYRLVFYGVTMQGSQSFYCSKTIIRVNTLQTPS